MTTTNEQPLDVAAIRERTELYALAPSGSVLEECAGDLAALLGALAGAQTEVAAQAAVIAKATAYNEAEAWPNSRLRAILSEPPTDALRARDEKKWAEGAEAAFAVAYDDEAPEPVNPYDTNPTQGATDHD